MSLKSRVSMQVYKKRKEIEKEITYDVERHYRAEFHRFVQNGIKDVALLSVRVG